MQYTFRIAVAVVAIFFFGFIYIRIFKLKNADQSFRASKKCHDVTGYDLTVLKLVCGHYRHRLFATSLFWFCNDFLFYGNQIYGDVLL